MTVQVVMGQTIEVPGDKVQFHLLRTKGCNSATIMALVMDQVMDLLPVVNISADVTDLYDDFFNTRVFHFLGH